MFPKDVLKISSFGWSLRKAVSYLKYILEAAPHENILEATPYKTVTVRLRASYLTNHPSKTNKAC